MENIFCFICNHKFTDQEIINDQFNICCNPNCNNVIEIMNNMDIVTAQLTDDNYNDMEINDNTCKIFFSDDF